jgi:hypothetical protein
MPWESRSNPYTVEGEFEMMGDFATSAKRARGWNGWVGRALLGYMLLGMLASLVLMVMLAVINW